MTARIPVLLDCDPGHDDALAITLALARPELDVLGITTVAGNVGLRETTRNTLRLLALLGRTDVPVAAGAAAPLLRPLEIADDVHGESGLDGADLPEPQSERPPRGRPRVPARDPGGGARPRHADPDRAPDQHRPAARSPRRRSHRRSPTSA